MAGEGVPGRQVLLVRDIRKAGMGRGSCIGRLRGFAACPFSTFLFCLLALLSFDEGTWQYDRQRLMADGLLLVLEGLSGAALLSVLAVFASFAATALSFVLPPSSSLFPLPSSPLPPSSRSLSLFKPQRALFLDPYSPLAQ